MARPIFVTTISLTLGFATLLLSIFQPLAILGAATAVTLVVALLFDLLVLPSLLVVAGYRAGD